MALQNINIGTTANDGTGDDARTWATKSNANFQYLEALAGSLASEVEFTYLNVAAMYAAQANQNVGKLEYVLDASGHTDVSTTEARHFEYLGTTVGDETDYRLLSATETAGIIAGNANTFTVDAVQDDTIPLTQTGPTKIGFEYDDGTDKISGVLFNLRYTDRVQRYVDLTGSNTYYLHIYNKTKNADQIAKITGFATVNIDYTLASLENTITATDVIDIDDIVEIRWDVDDNTSSAPIPTTYANLAALVAAQGSQILNYIYEVTDGSGFTGVSSGAIWVKYLGTTVGNETDYIIISKAVNSGGGDMLASTYDPANKAEQVLTIGDKAVANGVASLGGDGKVPAAQLPSYVDDVIEGYYDSGTFYEEVGLVTPIVPTTGKIYIDLSTEDTYRYSGSVYVKISDVLSAADVKTLYESNADTNAFTDALLAKLNDLKVQAITGTRVTASVSSTYAIDLNNGDVFLLTMTADTTFSFSNLPTGTNTKTFEVILTGAFTPTFPAYAVATPSSDTYNGAVRNRYIFDVINGTTSSEDIITTIENLAS